MFLAALTVAMPLAKKRERASHGFLCLLKREVPAAS
jgi:hypothetical protein